MLCLAEDSRKPITTNGHSVLIGLFLMSCEGLEESLQDCACSSGVFVLPVFLQSAKGNSFYFYPCCSPDC